MLELLLPGLHLGSSGLGGDKTHHRGLWGESRRPVVANVGLMFRIRLSMVYCLTWFNYLFWYIIDISRMDALEWICTLLHYYLLYKQYIAAVRWRFNHQTGLKDVKHGR
jgi:hypothetical protein